MFLHVSKFTFSVLHVVYKLVCFVLAVLFFIFPSLLHVRHSAGEAVSFDRFIQVIPRYMHRSYNFFALGIPQ